MAYPSDNDVVQAISVLVELEPFRQVCLTFVEKLMPLLQQFCGQPPCPQTTHQFELDLATQLRLFGRDLTQQAFHQFESADALQPPRVHHAGSWYRRRRQHPNLIATWFGTIELKRYLYEACEPGEPAIHPLEIYLGIEAGNATPALAEHVGHWAAQHPQESVLQLLWDEHGVHWSTDTLRKVTASLADGLAGHRQEAQVQLLLKWLQAADASRGPHRPVLAAGRDGIHLPLRDGDYHEGATATVSVHDRRGKRLGTVYLGQMPEEKQVTLSAQLTALLVAVLHGWTGPLPRLAYITDAGSHPTEYYRRVLCRMAHPRQPGQRLTWQWIVDYYHAAGYVQQLADALFGDTKAGKKWAKRMRHWLKHRRQGLANVLRSATAHRNGRRLSKSDATEYGKAYRYLRRHAPFLNYEQYRRYGLPIGSGVTEAACKTIFTQRFKQSGMRWNIRSGQAIVNLRVILRSGVWRAVNQAFRAAKELPTTTSEGRQPARRRHKAA